MPQASPVTVEEIHGLYDNLLRLLSEAESAYRVHAPSWTDLFCRRLVAAQEILTQLISSLGSSPSATNLHRIYDYMDFHLAQATLSYDPASIHEVTRLLHDLRTSTS